MSERVTLWREHYGHFETDPDWLIERIETCGDFLGDVSLADRDLFSRLSPAVRTDYMLIGGLPAVDVGL